MTFTSSEGSKQYDGNGASSTFATGFTFAKNADVRVVLGVANSNGGYDELALQAGTDYTITGSGNDDGGTIVYPASGSSHHVLAEGERLTILLEPVIRQETSLAANTAYDPEVHESAFDLLTMICLHLRQQIGRCVRYPVSSTEDEVLDSEAFLAATTANKSAAQDAQTAAELSRAAALAAQIAAALAASEAADSATAAASSAATASAGAAVIVANQTKINSVYANEAEIQAAPTNAATASAKASEASASAQAAGQSATAAASSAAQAASSAAAAAETVSSGLPDATTSAKGKVLLAASGGTTAGSVVQATDARLSDSRKCDNTFDDAAAARANLGAQPFDAATAKTNAAQSWSRQQYAAPVALTSSAGALSLDNDLHQLAKHTLTAITTVGVPTNMAEGQTGELQVTGAGSNTLAFNASGWAMADGSTINVTPAAGKVTRIIWRSNGTKNVIYAVKQEA